MALRALVIVALASALCACGGGESAEAAPLSRGAKGSSGPTGAAFTQPKEVLVPEIHDPGTETFIDTSATAEGYVAAGATSPSRLKFQVVCGEMTYNYDLPSDGTPTVFPLNMGNGTYRFRIMVNIEGNSYAEMDSTSADVELKSEFSPFLIPNIFCDYDEKSACTAKARELTKSSANAGEAVRDICDYVINNVTYDYDKAEELAKGSGYIPDPDDTLKTGTGICFDYASLTVAMLRGVGIPARLLTGYVSPGNLYHSWVMVYVDGTWKTALFSVTPNTWSRCDVTFASTGGDGYTGDGNSYTDKYVY